ncbi:MAG: tetratricopeptide repeat protein [Bdellovibrionales bacterium]|nr:tetratricopeptide repeat protein [Bdellovibrionales bacterium]
MKKLLFCQLGVILAVTSACSTLGQRGGAYRTDALSNLNPAPAKLTPPDYISSNSETPVLDDTYLSSQADYHYTMGETFSNEGQSPRAIEEYKSTLVYDPKSVHVRLALAREYVRMGMITEAVEQGEIAVDMSPESVDARMLLGGLYTGLKMFQPARDQFQAILTKEPGHAEAAVYLGALLAEERKFDESIKYFESLAKNQAFKESEKAYYYIGRVHSEQGQSHYAEAKQAFGKALQIKPDYSEAALSLAMVLRAENKSKEMEQLLRSFQEKFGPAREMSRQLSHYYLEKEDYDKALEQLEVFDSFERDNINIKFQIALILIEKKRFESAAQRLEDILLQEPQSDKVRYYLGAVYEELNQTQLSLEHYKHIGSGSNYFADAVLRTAQLHKTTGRLDKAIETMEAAIKQQDDLPQLYAYLATLLDDQKNFKKALKMLTVAVERFPSNTQLRFFLGTMQDRMGNPKETIAQMTKVIEQDEDHVQALNYLAYTYAELGDNLDQAESLAARALKLQPNDGYILDTLGWIHFKRGRIEDAIKYLEAAYKLRSDEAIIAEHLGDAYLRHQMWQKAQRMYQKAAQLEGEGTRYGKIQEKLANIRSQTEKLPARAPASLADPRAQ